MFYVSNKMMKLVSILTFAAIAHAGRLSFQERKIFPELKIVGGNDTDIKDHPWLVSIRNDGAHYCGGSLIADDWVVTAAHCVDIPDPVNRTVKVGSTFRSSGGTEYQINRIIIHPEWDNNAGNHDIALLQLLQVTDDPIASFINLPLQGTTLPAGTNLTVAGWGDTKEGSGALSEILQQVVIPVVSTLECAIIYLGHSMKVTKNNICIGLLGVGGKNSCQGDSGGPAAMGPVLYGIASWARGCGRPRYPGVYTKVANYVDWIRSNTQI